MIAIRRAGERGRTRTGWLDSAHTFSFGGYHDPDHMGFGVLRVINEDRVRPGHGFDPHSHRDMEIVSYVIEGALAHRDSLGTGSVIRPGEVQRMTAGRGVTHSEYNESREAVVHFLQIWILPEQSGLPPSYEQRAYPDHEKRNRLCLVASRDGRDDSITVHQDASIFVAALDSGSRVTHAGRDGRGAWVQVVNGEVELNGRRLQAGDGAAATDQPQLVVEAVAASEILVFDVPLA
jgi:redox-sensitive bicupin YhaK (pirin superfamily)